MNIEQQRAAFEAAYLQAFPFASSKTDKFALDGNGDYEDVQVLVGFRMWLAAIELDRQGRGEPVAWQAVDHSGYRPQPADPVVKESLTVEPVRQYYYQVTGCTADSTTDPSCICWHDEGTGPLVKIPHYIKSWRNKPAQQDADKVDALPGRDTSRPAERQGLFRKFDVRRTDSSDQPGGKHYGCRYFVLDIDHDAYAGAALSAYATACEPTHPELAQDLREKWGAVQPASGEDARDAGLEDAVEIISDAHAENDREVGRKWREDSSLETWFPITAEELSRLKVEVVKLRAAQSDPILQKSTERLLNLVVFELQDNQIREPWVSAIADLKKALRCAQPASGEDAKPARAKVSSAPSPLNMNDKAFWVMGWNDCLDSMQQERQP